MSEVSNTPSVPDDGSVTVRWDDDGVPRYPDGTIFGCDVCGKHYDFSITVDEMGQRVLCGTCERLIQSGLLRPEADDQGRTVYRRWEFQPMTPTNRVFPVRRR